MFELLITFILLLKFSTIQNREVRFFMNILKVAGFIIFIIKLA